MNGEAGEAVAPYARAVRTLLIRPGQLTLDACAGPRPNVLQAMAAFLAAATLYFGAAAFTAAPVGERGVMRQTAADSAVLLITDSLSFVDAPEVVANPLVRILGPARAWTLLTHQSALQDIVVTTVPRAAFLLVPLFAAMTLVAWRHEAGGYARHLVFAMHVHAAGFAALFVPAAVPPLQRGWLGTTASVAVLAYTTWYTIVAARVALGGTAREVNARLTIAGMLYMPAIVAATLVGTLLAARSV